VARTLHITLGLVVLGAIVPAGSAAAGGSCGNPHHSSMTRGDVRTMLRGEETLVRTVQGPTIRFFSGKGETGRHVYVSMTAPGWRLCALSTAPPGARVVAPVRRSDGASRLDRKFTRDPTSLRVWYARRNASADGSSCANPYVVWANEFGARGDVQAGRLELEDSHGANGEQQVDVVARWAPKPGYTTCYVKAAPMFGGDPWTHRASAGDRVVYRYSCCGGGGYGGSAIAYLFAAFRRTSGGA
jgi:hypothetical protein